MFEITEDTRFFWESCQTNKLVVQICDSCKCARYYPRMVCPSCGSQDFCWIEASGLGTIYSYTRIGARYRPKTGKETVVLVDLEEGVRMLGNLVGRVPNSKPLIGHAVCVRFTEEPDGFRLPNWALLNGE